MFGNYTKYPRTILTNQTAIAVTDWLRGRRNIATASPVFVQICHRTYSAAQYIEGQNDVEETRLYVVGEMPPLQSQMRRNCYRTDDSDYDWHLVAWFRQRTACTEWQEVHPFGSHFILAQWSPLENWAADQCERQRFRRTPMTITNCIGPTDASVNQPTEKEET